MGIGAEGFADGAFEHAHAVAVDDAHALDGGEHGGVEKFIDLRESFFGALSDDVQFAREDLEVGTGFEAGAFLGGAGSRTTSTTSSRGICIFSEPASTSTRPFLSRRRTSGDFAHTF